jgi:hypothetical protein
MRTRGERSGPQARLQARSRPTPLSPPSSPPPTLRASLGHHTRDEHQWPRRRALLIAYPSRTTWRFAMTPADPCGVMHRHLGPPTRKGRAGWWGGVLVLGGPHAQDLDRSIQLCVAWVGRWRGRESSHTKAGLSPTHSPSLPALCLSVPGRPLKASQAYQRGSRM